MLAESHVKMVQFNKLHPLIILIYYISIFGFTIYNQNPIMIMISLVSSIVMAYLSIDIHTFKKRLKYLLLIFVLIVIINPIFSHKGMNALFYVNGNAITVESIVYGFVFASIIISVMFWFISFNEIMSSDKIVYLFGQALPIISIIIAMVLRFIPHFQRRMDTINEVSNINGDGKPTLANKINHALKNFSIIVTWGFENSLDTANSMKARGYLLKNKSFYANFRFTKKDSRFLVILIILLIMALISQFVNDYYFYYFPEIAKIDNSLLGIFGYFIYLLLMSLPLIYEGREALKWHILVSRI